MIKEEMERRGQRALAHIACQLIILMAFCSHAIPALCHKSLPLTFFFCPLTDSPRQLFRIYKQEPSILLPKDPVKNE